MRVPTHTMVVDAQVSVPVAGSFAATTASVGCAGKPALFTDRTADGGMVVGKRRRLLRAA